VPYNVVGCCEFDKHRSGLLLSRKAIHDLPFQQGALVYGRPPVPKARLLLQEQWVDGWFDTKVDESLEDFKGNAQHRYKSGSSLGPQWLFCLRIPQVLESFTERTAFVDEPGGLVAPCPVCPVLHDLRRYGVCHGAHTREVSRPVSKFVDGAPLLAVRVREVGGINGFLPSLLLLMFLQRW